jgi:hypothetical protein
VRDRFGFDAVRTGLEPRSGQKKSEKYWGGFQKEQDKS